MHLRPRHHRKHDHPTGPSPLPRAPFGPVTIHARTGAEILGLGGADSHP